MDKKCPHQDLNNEFHERAWNDLSNENSPDKSGGANAPTYLTDCSIFSDI